MTFPLGDTTRFRHEFDWTGTRDISASCSLPATIEYMEKMVDGGWPAIMKHNHDLAMEGRRILCERLGLDEPCPEDMIDQQKSETYHIIDRTGKVRFTSCVSKRRTVLT